MMLSLDKLTKPPIQGYPDPAQPFVLDMDASQDGLGTVLYQRQNNKMVVIDYGSRTLTPPEKNYYMHSGRLEFLSLKWAICERFRDYLYHAPQFVVYTNINPVKVSATLVTIIAAQLIFTTRLFLFESTFQSALLAILLPPMLLSLI